MLIAGLMFSMMNVSVKLIPHIPAIQIILFRSLMSFGMTYFFLKRKRIPLFGNNHKLLILRGITGSVGLICFFYTLQKIPLASAVSINYLAPIFTTLLGIFIVKETVKIKQFLFFGISFAGVLLIEGFDPRIQFFDLLIGLIAAIAMGVAYNIIRKLKNSEDPLVIMFYFPLITTPIVAIISYYIWVTPQGWDWVVLIVIGFLTQLAQYFMTMAYQNANLAKISSLSYLGIIYALIFGFILFAETYHIITYLGMVLVLSGVFLNLKK
jgi:drug/metabolite transporter (DMT)-like permease